ncbi:gas vesicle protein [Nonomuraea jabiensis]|uniref:gas vesicle protein n=1 Tax=Nonomuraea jabiensis TaxID=882448 RepID=UPI003D75035C
MTHDAPPRGAVLAAEERLPAERVALVDLLDRLLAGGVVVSGDLVLSIADIDLVRISVRALIMSIRESEPFGGIDGEPSR